MSKRNLILLIIFLIIMSVVVLIFLSSYKQSSTSTSSTGTNFVSNFFPFGKSNTVTPGNTESPTNVSGYVAPISAINSANKLKRVSNLTVAGYGVYMKERFKDVAVTTSTTETNLPPPPPPVVSTKKGKATLKTKIVLPPTEFVPSLRYVEKSRGNIYETFADKIEERKFSSIVVPQVYEAYFGNNGDSVIMRYLKDDDKTIETFLASLPKEVLGGDVLGNNELGGTFLPENISDLSLSYDTTKLFYLFNTSDYAVGITANATGDKKSQIFSSPFTEWLSSWPNAGMVTLTTKPASAVPGYMYTLNPNSKSLNKVLSGINGLTTLTSPNGKLILYGNNNLSLNIFNMDTKKPTSVGAKTLPEKCTWNSTSTGIYCAVPKFVDQGDYPDTWYQGEVSFNDEIWKIDATTGNASLITDPSFLPGGEETDGIKLSLDSGENYLFFMNKNDYSLWELSLK